MPPREQNGPTGPPANLDPEKAAVGCGLFNAEAAVKVIEVPASDFAHRPHGYIRDAYEAILNAGAVPDVLSVHAELLRRGRVGSEPDAQKESRAYLFELADLAFPPNFESNLQAVRDQAAYRAGLREVDALKGELIRQDRPPGELFGDAARRFYTLESRGNRVQAADAPELVRVAFRAVIPRLEWAEAQEALGNADPSAFATVPTGWSALDRMTGGLRNGTLTVLAGRSSMGKSQFAFAIARNACEAGHPAAFYSLEMTEEQIGVRLLALEAGYPVRALERPVPRSRGEVEWDDVWDGGGRIGLWPLWTVDQQRMGEFQLSALRAHVSEMQRRYGVELVVIDHLHKFPKPEFRQNNHEAYTAICQALHSMTLTLKVSVLLLAQLSRNVEKRENKRPILSDLRESGSIEEIADAVWLLYRQNYYAKEPETEQLDLPNQVEVIVAKSRILGETGVAKLHFDKKTGRYFDYDTWHQEWSG
jgi:replicative DNA helicase